MNRKSIKIWKIDDASITAKAELFKDNTHGLKQSHIVFKLVCKKGGSNFEFVDSAVSITLLEAGTENSIPLQIDMNTINNAKIIESKNITFEIYGVIPKTEIEGLDSKNFILKIPDIKYGLKQHQIPSVIFSI